MLRCNGFENFAVYREIVVSFPVLISGTKSDFTNGCDKRADGSRRRREGFDQHELSVEISICLEVKFYFGKYSWVD